MKKRLLLNLTGILCACCMTSCGSPQEQVPEDAQNAVVQETEEAVEEVQEESKEEIPTDNSDERAAEEAPVFGEFVAITTDGDEVTQEIFAEADLTMVNIWGTFCGPCINEMPDLGEIAREYKDSGFQIVGIITDIYEYGDETVDEIIEVTGADYTHLLLSIDLYNNYLNSIQVVPTTVFVDSEGKEVGIYTGSRSKEDWEAVIEELRAKVSTQGQEQTEADEG